MTEASKSLELDFKLAGAGWADLHVRVGDLHYEIEGISYLTDALDDLIRLGIDIATNRGFGYAQFDHEPASTILFAEAGWWDDTGWSNGHRISVIDWSASDQLGWETLSNASRLFKAEVPSRDSIAAAILACAERVLDTFGTEGYSKQWAGRLGFPVRALAALRAALSVDLEERA